MDSRCRTVPFLALCFLELLVASQVSGAARVPAVFVFGDSTADVGNNDYLRNCSAGARANYPYYGIDFPNSTPTGRFSNGYNTADCVAKLLGFPMSPPAYLSLRTQESIASQMLGGGVNFASGGSGILDKTGLRFREVVSTSAQLQYFSSAVELLRAANGANATAQHLTESMFFVTMGSNDMFEYAASQTSVSASGAREFLSTLVGKYRGDLLTLYGLGARKFSITGTSLLGCCPAWRAASNATGGACFEPLNDLSHLFNRMVANMLRTMVSSRNMPGARYSFADGAAILSLVAADPRRFRMRELRRACCGAGAFGASGCGPSSPVCADRDDHVFWDLFHPTQALSRIVAMYLYSGSAPYVLPVNVQQLAAM